LNTYGHNNMIKKRSRPTARVREPSPEVEEKGTTSDTPEGEKNPPRHPGTAEAASGPARYRCYKAL